MKASVLWELHVKNRKVCVFCIDFVGPFNKIHLKIHVFCSRNLNMSQILFGEKNSLRPRWGVRRWNPPYGLLLNTDI